MEMSVLQNTNEVLYLLPLLQQALSDNNVELALNMFRRVNPLLLNISMLINAPDNSNLDVALRGLVETCAVLSQCLGEIDGFVCDEQQISAVRYIIDTLRDIRPIITSSTEETLNQNLEEFFSTGNGDCPKGRIIFFYTLLVGVATLTSVMGAGYYLNLVGQFFFSTPK